MDEMVQFEGLKSELKKEARKAKVDLNELKSGGFIKQIQRDLFTVRLRCPGGRLTSEQLSKAAEIAQKYGRGVAHLSVRQSVEIPYVNYQDFDRVTEELREIGWAVASCGPRVRVPTACAGCEYNPNGLGDTQEMAMEVDRRYFGIPTGHHKFKVSFSGCPIDCFRTREMDLGFQAVVEPQLIEELCTGCELCVKACEDQALHMENELPVRNWDRCIGCGDCIKVCPVNAMVTQKSGWLVRGGGKHGKHPLFAYEVANFASAEQVFQIIEKTLEWYQKNGEKRERIGATIGRLGLQKYMEEVIKPVGVEPIEDSRQRRKYWAGGNFYD